MTDFLGWANLTPNEQMAAVSGGVLTAASLLGGRVLFGGLALKRKKRTKRRKKGRR